MGLFNFGKRKEKQLEEERLREEEEYKLRQEQIQQKNDNEALKDLDELDSKIKIFFERGQMDFSKTFLLDINEELIEPLEKLKSYKGLFSEEVGTRIEDTLSFAASIMIRNLDDAEAVKKNALSEENINMMFVPFISHFESIESMLDQEERDKKTDGSIEYLSRISKISKLIDYYLIKNPDEFAECRRLKEKEGKILRYNIALYGPFTERSYQEELTR